MKGFYLLVTFLSLAISAYAQTPQVEAKLLDEFEGNGCEDYLGRLDYVGSVVAENPDSRVFVFVYEGKTRQVIQKPNSKYVENYVLPQYGLAGIRIDTMKKGLTWRYRSNNRFDLKRVVFVNAGFRERFNVAIWLVPKGVPEPLPTPTIGKMKYRSGKPYGFCTECCGGS